MSLDVYLTAAAPRVTAAGSGIFIREAGSTKEISLAEWDERFPDREPIVITADAPASREVYSRNITHNLGRMADEAGIYRACWRPDEIGITKAHQLIQPLTDGLAALQTEPDRFRAINPENGWGNYEGFVDFVAEYLSACMANPDAEVSVSR